ncbi:hypothetical protein OKW32_004161 [Paraburkholderia youngii]
MSDILDRIIAVKREEIRAAEQSVPLEELRLEASSRDLRDFVGAIRAKHTAGSRRGDLRSEEGKPVEGRAARALRAGRHRAFV